MHGPGGYVPHAWGSATPGGWHSARPGGWGQGGPGGPWGPGMPPAMPGMWSPGVMPWGPMAWPGMPAPRSHPAMAVPTSTRLPAYNDNRERKKKKRKKSRSARSSSESSAGARRSSKRHAQIAAEKTLEILQGAERSKSAEARLPRQKGSDASDALMPTTGASSPSASAIDEQLRSTPPKSAPPATQQELCIAKALLRQLCSAPPATSDAGSIATRPKAARAPPATQKQLGEDAALGLTPVPKAARAPPATRTERSDDDVGRAPVPKAGRAPLAPQTLVEKRGAAVASAADVSRQIIQRVLDLDDETALKRIHEEGMKQDVQWQQRFRHFCTARGVMIYDRMLQDRDFLAKFFAENFVDFMTAPWAKQILETVQAQEELASKALTSRKESAFKIVADKSVVSLGFSTGAPPELVVKKCKPQSWAEKVGIMLGDRLTSVNSAPASSLTKDDIVRLMHERPLSLEFLRTCEEESSPDTVLQMSSPTSMAFLEVDKPMSLPAVPASSALSSSTVAPEVHAPVSARAVPASEEKTLRPGASARAEELRKWLLSLDDGKGGMLKYYNALEDEFDADLRQILAVREVEVSNSIVDSIDPVFWEIVGVTLTGHKFLFAKGIAKLSQNRQQ